MPMTQAAANRLLLRLAASLALCVLCLVFLPQLLLRPGEAGLGASGRDAPHEPLMKPLLRSSKKMRQDFGSGDEHPAHHHGHGDSPGGVAFGRPPSKMLGQLHAAEPKPRPGQSKHGRDQEYHSSTSAGGESPCGPRQCVCMPV
jgi:hypothetical protein